MRNKNRENTRQRKIITRKIVFTWFGNLPMSTKLQGFHYYQGKKIQIRQYSFFSLSKTTMTNTISLRKSPIKNHATLFRVGSSFGSNTTRLHKIQQISHLETSSITNINHNPPKTIPHPCNTYSCPQARRPTKAAHNFNFSIVTPLVNMSVGFLDPQIFSSITNLSSTR